MQVAQTTVEENRVKKAKHYQSNAQAQSALKVYRNEQALNLSPVEVIKRIYDLAIQHCKRDNPEKAQRVISELIVALDFTQGELSVDLFHMYTYLKKCIREGKMDEAVDLLQELRETWVEAFNLQ